MNHDLVGSGMPMWLPNGALIRKQLENYIYEKEQKSIGKLFRTPSNASGRNRMDHR